MNGGNYRTAMCWNWLQIGVYEVRVKVLLKCLSQKHTKAKSAKYGHKAIKSCWLIFAWSFKSEY